MKPDVNNGDNMGLNMLWLCGFVLCLYNQPSVHVLLPRLTPESELLIPTGSEQHEVLQVGSI